MRDYEAEHYFALGIDCEIKKIKYELNVLSAVVQEPHLKVELSQLVVRIDEEYCEEYRKVMADNFMINKKTT